MRNSSSKKATSESDFASRMARREIVFQRPTRYWQDGFAIGNGDLGGAVYGGHPDLDGTIGITLNKVDVWDLRYDRKGHTYHTLEEMRALIAQHKDTPEGRRFLAGIEPFNTVSTNNWLNRSYPYPYTSPSIKPCGLVRVDAGDACEAFESRLSIHRGEAAFNLGTPEKGADVTAAVHANTNVLLVRVDRHGGHERCVSFELARYVDDQLGTPETGYEGDAAMWLRYSFPDGFTYALYALVGNGAHCRSELTERTWKDVEATITRTPQGHKNIDVPIEFPEKGVKLTLDSSHNSAVLYVGVATTNDADDPLTCARRLAREASEKAYQSLKAHHQEWWDRFWRRSSLFVSNRMVETLWYHGVYLAACLCRGSVIPHTMCPGYYLPYGGWHGQFITNYNVQMLCWPGFIANHLELSQVFFDYYLAKMDVMKDDTRSIWGLEGLKVPGISDPTGRELAYLPGRNWQCVSAWIAQLFWWGYTYSGDIEFLRTKAYPFMREVTIFYRAYAVMGDDGKYHIFPSAPPEQSPWWSTDPGVDITLLRMHLKATLEAAEILDADRELLPRWRELLDNLVGAPVRDGLLLDHRDADPLCTLSHTALMCITYTAGEIGIDSPSDQRELAVRSMHSAASRGGRTVVDFPVDMKIWNDDCCWPNLIGYAARLGLPNDAKRYLYDYGIFQHLKPNGQFAFDCPVNDSQRETRWGMPDSSTAMTAAVSEMLIQSHDGAIRIAPAWPSDWDAEFENLLAFGAFEVSATLLTGRVTRLCVRSLKGNACRIVNPWPNEVVTVTTGAGDAVEYVIQGSTIEFATRKDTTYFIRGKDEPLRMDVSDEPAKPIRYWGPLYEPGVRDSQRTDTWLGAPALNQQLGRRDSEATGH